MVSVVGETRATVSFSKSAEGEELPILGFFEGDEDSGGVASRFCVCDLVGLELFDDDPKYLLIDCCFLWFWLETASWDMPGKKRAKDCCFLFDIKDC